VMLLLPVASMLPVPSAGFCISRAPKG
jgi:hypothetical protein